MRLGSSLATFLFSHWQSLKHIYYNQTSSRRLFVFCFIGGNKLLFLLLFNESFALVALAELTRKRQSTRGQSNLCGVCVTIVLLLARLDSYFSSYFLLSLH